MATIIDMLKETITPILPPDLQAAVQQAHQLPKALQKAQPYRGISWTFDYGKGTIKNVAFIDTAGKRVGIDGTWVDPYAWIDAYLAQRQATPAVLPAPAPSSIPSAPSPAPALAPSTLPPWIIPAALAGVVALFLWKKS